jgi:hypothetical protein
MGSCAPTRFLLWASRDALVPATGGTANRRLGGKLWT